MREEPASAITGRVPWFGTRRFAKRLQLEAKVLKKEADDTRAQLDRIADMGRQLAAETKVLRAHRARVQHLEAYSIAELESRKVEVEQDLTAIHQEILETQSKAKVELAAIKAEAQRARAKIAETDEAALLQEVGVYQYKHPLNDAVAYSTALKIIEERVKAMTLKDGGAIQSAGDWTVNGSAKEGKAMIREYSKLMLRAFNAEAETLVRWLKPYKVDAAIDRLRKSADTIERLGKTMKIRISEEYFKVRATELELTADFLQKQAEQKEQERLERERLREEQKAQREIEAERTRLAKEREHHFNALQRLIANGDADGASRMKEQLSEIDSEISAVDFRAANIRAGYVYLISNVGSFGESMVKLGLTRRLNPMDRIRELSDASVPFNFDIHALFFSKDAVSIETAMHQRLSSARVNLVNKRREFFRATPADVKKHLSELTGELLEFQEEPEALEYRQTIQLRRHEQPDA